MGARTDLASAPGSAYTRHTFVDATRRLQGPPACPAAASPGPDVLVGEAQSVWMRELGDVNLRKKVFLYTSTVAILASGIGLLLVGQLVATTGDAQLAHAIVWDLLVIALAAGALPLAAAWLVVQRVTPPLRRPAAPLSRMASAGGVQPDFPRAAGRARRHLQPSRALGRRWLPARPLRRVDPAHRPHLRRRRRLRRDDLGPPLPAGAPPHAGDRRAGAGGRRAARPGGGRGLLPGPGGRVGAG